MLVVPVRTRRRLRTTTCPAAHAAADHPPLHNTLACRGVQPQAGALPAKAADDDWQATWKYRSARPDSARSAARSGTHRPGTVDSAPPEDETLRPCGPYVQPSVWRCSGLLS